MRDCSIVLYHKKSFQEREQLQPRRKDRESELLAASTSSINIDNETALAEYNHNQAGVYIL